MTKYLQPYIPFKYGDLVNKIKYPRISQMVFQKKNTQPKSPNYDKNFPNTNPQGFLPGFNNEKFK